MRDGRTGELVVTGGKHKRWDDSEAEMFTGSRSPVDGELRMWRAVLAQGIKEAFLHRGDEVALPKGVMRCEAELWIVDASEKVGSANWIASRTGLEFVLARARRLLRDESQCCEIAERVAGISMW